MLGSEAANFGLGPSLRKLLFVHPLNFEGPTRVGGISLFEIRINVDAAGVSNANDFDAAVETAGFVISGQLGEAKGAFYRIAKCPGVRLLRLALIFNAANDARAHQGALVVGAVAFRLDLD